MHIILAILFILTGIGLLILGYLHITHTDAILIFGFATACIFIGFGLLTKIYHDKQRRIRFYINLSKIEQMLVINPIDINSIEEQMLEIKPIEMV